MTNRKYEIASLSLFMCLLVVFIHVTSWTITKADIASVQYIFLLVPWRLSAFAVQGFLLLSGIKLFVSDRPLDYGKFLLSRLKKIFLPYLFAIAVYYAYFIWLGWYKFSFADLAQYIFLGTLCSHFYFIIILAQFYLLLPIFRLLFAKFDAKTVCAVSVVITIAFKLFVHFKYDDRVFVAYLCYFVIGAFIGKNYARCIEWLKRRFALLAVCFALLAATDAFFTVQSIVRGKVYGWFEALHLAYAFSAIFFFLTLFAIVADKRQKTPRILLLCEKSTYSVYLIHILFIYIINDLMWRAKITDMKTEYIIRFVFTYAVTFAVCTMYTAVKETVKAARNKK